MSKTPWSPGPWHTVKRQDEDEASLVCFEDGIIADCSSFTTGRPIGEDAANARLIAQSPRMAELLEDALTFLEHNALANLGDWERWADSVRVLLSEARGDQ